YSMNILSLNIRGAGEDHKRSWNKRLCFENKVKFMGLQESMSGDKNRLFIQSLWNNSPFDFVVKKPNGKSGGDRFLALSGKWVNLGIMCLMIVVYVPHDYHLECKLWDDISNLITVHNTLSIILGDFSEVRFSHEIIGSLFDGLGVFEFNNFISVMGLLDLPLGGKHFTRMNYDGSKLRKADRILFTKHLVDI
ncbi:cytochrome P450, partial [Tanacetum coccineum]